MTDQLRWHKSLVMSLPMLLFVFRWPEAPQLGPGFSMGTIVSGVKKNLFYAFQCVGLGIRHCKLKTKNKNRLTASRVSGLPKGKGLHEKHDKNRCKNAFIETTLRHYKGTIWFLSRYEGSL